MRPDTDQVATQLMVDAGRALERASLALFSSEDIEAAIDSLLFAASRLHSSASLRGRDALRYSGVRFQVSDGEEKVIAVYCRGCGTQLGVLFPGHETSILQAALGLANFEGSCEQSSGSSSFCESMNGPLPERSDGRFVCCDGGEPSLGDEFSSVTPRPVIRQSVVAGRWGFASAIASWWVRFKRSATRNP